VTSSEERLDTLIDDVARQMTDGAPAPDFTARVLQRVDDRLPRRGWRWAWVAAPIAAAAVALIAIQVFKFAPPATNEQTRHSAGAELAAPVVAPAVPPQPVAQASEPALETGRSTSRTLKVRRRPDATEVRGIDALAPPRLDVTPLDTTPLDDGRTLPDSIEVEQLDVIAPIAVTPLSANESQPLRQH
jgi:hypothetical protein